MKKITIISLFLIFILVFSGVCFAGLDVTPPGFNIGLDYSNCGYLKAVQEFQKCVLEKEYECEKCIEVSATTLNCAGFCKQTCYLPQAALCLKCQYTGQFCKSKRYDHTTPDPDCTITSCMKNVYEFCNKEAVAARESFIETLSKDTWDSCASPLEKKDCLGRYKEIATYEGIPDDILKDIAQNEDTDLLKNMGTEDLKKTQQFRLDSKKNPFTKEQIANDNLYNSYLQDVNSQLRNSASGVGPKGKSGGFLGDAFSKITDSMLGSIGGAFGQEIAKGIMGGEEKGQTNSPASNTDNSVNQNTGDITVTDTGEGMLQTMNAREIPTSDNITLGQDIQVATENGVITLNGNHAGVYADPSVPSYYNNRDNDVTTLSLIPTTLPGIIPFNNQLHMGGGELNTTSNAGSVTNNYNGGTISTIDPRTNTGVTVDNSHQSVVYQTNTASYDPNADSLVIGNVGSSNISIATNNFNGSVKMEGANSFIETKIEGGFARGCSSMVQNTLGHSNLNVSSIYTYRIDGPEEYDYIVIGKTVVSGDKIIQDSRPPTLDERRMKRINKEIGVSQ